MIKQNENTQIYGAGIISSTGETDHIFTDNIEVRPYVVDQVLDNDFITSEIQTRYYEIESFEELFNSVGELEKSLKQEVNV